MKFPPPSPLCGKFSLMEPPPKKVLVLEWFLSHQLKEFFGDVELVVKQVRNL
jgi:hypothetical protein